MAESIASILMENLEELMRCRRDLITGGEDQISWLYNELPLLIAFLEDLQIKFYEDEGAKNLEARIRDVVYEAETAVDLFVVETVLKEEMMKKAAEMKMKMKEWEKLKMEIEIEMKKEDMMRRRRKRRRMMMEEEEEMRWRRMEEEVEEMMRRRKRRRKRRRRRREEIMVQSCNLSRMVSSMLRRTEEKEEMTMRRRMEEEWETIWRMEEIVRRMEEEEGHYNKFGF